MEQNKDRAAKFWDRAWTYLEKFMDELHKLVHVGKIKLDAALFQRERSALYRQLGIETHRLLKEGRFDPAEVAAILERIDTLTQRIDEKNSALRDFRYARK